MYKKAQSFLSRQDHLAAAATIAAHSNAQGTAFRQKDVLFMFDLCANWCQSGFLREQLVYQNTQLARYLESLVKEGYARKTKEKKHPSYRLSRSGLIELLFRITNRYPANPEQFLFTFYFITNYKERLITLVKEEGKLFPAALKVELLAVLDHQALLDREIERIEILRRQLSERVSDAAKVAGLVEDSRRKFMDSGAIARLVELHFPYQLNNQKPLHELISGIPADQQIWEIGEGSLKRQAQIWRPLAEIIENYVKVLKSLRQGLN